MLVLVKSFSYTRHTSFNEESSFNEGFYLLIMIVLVRSFSYTPEGRFSEEFLLRCHASFSEECFLHPWF